MTMFAVLVATPALASDVPSPQFDLVCTGETRDSQFGKWKPIEVRYRVDLLAQSWCHGACEKVRKIHAIEPGRLLLSFQERSLDSRLRIEESVDRVSGAWRDDLTGSGLNGPYTETRGTCARAAFSGFPAPKF